MSLPIILLGGGGHASVVLDALLRSGAEIAGIIDPDPAVARHLGQIRPYLGGEDAFERYKPARYALANGVGGIATPQRRATFERWREAGYRFPPILHPAAAIASFGVVLGEGCQLMAGTVLQANSVLGANCVINTRASIDHDGRIGAHAHIAPGAVLCGGVMVGEGSHIGAGAIIIQGVRVGANCVIGAGTTLRHDTGDDVIVYDASERRERPRL
jgi:sugar O-acyltransferase (sialic acid O-acetyltransferase NeuD family)